MTGHQAKGIPSPTFRSGEQTFQERRAAHGGRLGSGHRALAGGDGPGHTSVPGGEESERSVAQPGSGANSDVEAKGAQTLVPTCAEAAGGRAFIFVLQHHDEPQTGPCPAGGRGPQGHCVH